VTFDEDYSEIKHTRNTLKLIQVIKNLCTQMVMKSSTWYTVKVWLQSTCLDASRKKSVTTELP